MEKINKAVINDIVSFIEKAILTSLDMDLSVSSLAEKTGYSRYYFSRLFAAVTGIPVSEYITRRRLAHGSELIKNSEKSITDIAMESGFSGLESFCKAFRREFGISPSVPSHLFRSTRVEAKASPSGPEADRVLGILFMPAH